MLRLASRDCPRGFAEFLDRSAGNPMLERRSLKWPIILGVLMIVLLGYAVSDFELWVGRSSSERLLHLGMWITVAAVAYLGALQLLGQNLHQLWQRPDASDPEFKQ